MKRNALLVVLAAALAVVLITGGLEVLARVTPLGDAGHVWYLGGSHPRNMVVGDPELGYRLRPNFRGREVSFRGDFVVPVEINSSGLRDTERDYGGCAGVILGLGDSYVFGEGVAVEDSLPAMLETRLKEGGRDGLCVVNAGVPGYGVHQVSRLYRRLGSRLPHRVVLFAFNQANIDRVYQGFAEYRGWIVSEAVLPVLQSCPNGNVFWEKESFNGVYRFLTCRSEAFSWLGRRTLAGHELASVWPNRNPGPLPVPAREEPPSYFLAMKEASRQNGASMVAIEICSHDEVFEQFCRTNGIGYLTVPCREDWFFKHDRHWNPAGHRAVADIVFNSLSASGLLP